MVIKAKAPGDTYAYDIGEKDSDYSNENSFSFKTIQIKLNDRMPKSMVLVDMTFIDNSNNKVILESVDLLKWIPKLDGTGDLIYPEMIEEEYNRFGINFRKELNEYKMEAPDDFYNKSYRVNVTNNCLEPTKFEFAITSEDYSDFSKRCKDSLNLNQNKTLSHSWFNLDETLYKRLMQLKNPKMDIDFNFTMDYNDISKKAENVVIDFNTLRYPIKYASKIETVEIGHQSKRKIEPLDLEEYYKHEAKLLLSEKAYTYASILENPIQTTQFKDEGFYSEATPKTFDWNWLKYIDDIKLDVIKVPGSDAFVEIKLTGAYAPYDITFGNIDLSLIDEQSLYGLLFGINTYPKSRLYNQNSVARVYDPELIPDDIKPYLWLTDKDTGQWINNQYKGVEKIYLTFNDIEHDILDIYLLSYERITPVWMGKVKLPNNIRETIRIRKSLYSN